MCETGYSIAALAADLRELHASGADEGAMLDGAARLVARLVRMKHGWLRPAMCKPGSDPGKAGVHLLHEEPGHRLALFVVAWMPGEETPPHDHATWAIIAGLEGRETNHWWERLDDGSRPGYAEVRRAGREPVAAGTLITMPSRAIHSLHNDSDGVSITLHLYGVNVDYTSRSRFDPERRTSAPYAMGGTVGRPATA